MVFPANSPTSLQAPAVAALDAAGAADALAGADDDAAPAPLLFAEALPPDPLDSFDPQPANTTSDNTNRRFIQTS